MLGRIENQSHGAVASRVEVSITASPEELKELRAALAIVDRFKKVALKTAKLKDSRKENDWLMTGFAVKTDVCRVVVEAGSAG